MQLKHFIIAAMLFISSTVKAAITLTVSEQQQLAGYELVSERVPYMMGTTAVGYTQVFYNMNYSPLRINLYAKPFGASFLYKALVIDTRQNYKYRGIVTFSRNPDRYVSGINDSEPFSPEHSIDISNMHLKGSYLKTCILWINSPL